MCNAKTLLIYCIHSSVEQYLIWMRRAELGVGLTCREPAQQYVEESDDLQELVNTPEFAQMQQQRKKVEALFAELKNQIGLQRLRLRRLKFVREQFFLAAVAQNIQRLPRFLSQLKHQCNKRRTYLVYRIFGPSTANFQ